MRKKFWKIFWLIVLGVIIFIWLVKANVFAFYLSHKIRVPVSIGWLNTAPTHAHLRDFRIDNLRQFQNRSAFHVHDVKMLYQWNHLLANPLVIDLLHMQDVLLDIELLNASGSENNWTMMSDRMKPSKGKKQVVIRKLILDNLTIEILGSSLIGGAIRRQVDHLEFENISSQKGFPTEQLIHEVFGGAGVEGYIQNAFNPGELIEGVISPFREL